MNLETDKLIIYYLLCTVHHSEGKVTWKVYVLDL